MKKCKQNKTKRKEKKNELFQESSTVHPLYWRNSIRYVRICPIWNKYFFKTLPVELPQARAVPETFSCLDKTAGYFFIVKTTQRKLHLSTGKNYHLTRRQLTRNKPVQWVFIISHWFLHGTWLLLYKTSQQSLPVLFQLSACQCCSEPVDGTKLIISKLRSKRTTVKSPIRNEVKMPGIGGYREHGLVHAIFYSFWKKAKKRFSHQLNSKIN